MIGYWNQFLKTKTYWSSSLQYVNIYYLDKLINEIKIFLSDSGWGPVVRQSAIVNELRKLF